MSKSKLKKARGIEELKSRYGFFFVLPWIIGLIMFFFIPIIQSIIYSFCSVVVTSDGVKTTWVGLENYKEILKVDPKYTTWLTESITSFAYSLPIILVLSLILAIMLNQNFRGRVFFRALYFLPVIIATGKVMSYVFTTTDENLVEMGVSAGMASGMIKVEDLTSALNMGTEVATFISNAINNIFNLVWSCGIQIVLFLAGLQSIPSTLYEASKVEGATKWEEFWFITFPMLSRITLLVGIFTMVELFINERAPMIEQVYGKMRGGQYDIPSAMIWFYFIAACAIMGILILLFYKFILKRYEA
ncbi:MAG: sugar ABC transporter permease [Clostridia bacterium]|nr:sugar ABC transporter permease [Clostridia bacterium]